jgi:hypothetical protein
MSRTAADDLADLGDLGRTTDARTAVERAG